MRTTEAIKSNKRAIIWSAVTSLGDRSEIILIRGFTDQETLPIIISIIIFFINVTQDEIILILFTFFWQTPLFSMVFFEIALFCFPKLSKTTAVA